MTMKEAIAIAKRYFNDPDDVEVQQLRLEEVEISEDERYWTVTLSGKLPETTGSELATLLSPRVYRSITIDSETGKLKAIKLHPDAPYAGV